MIIPFETPLGTLAIADTKLMDNTKSQETNAQEFLERIANQTYFEFYDEGLIIGKQPSLPEGYSYENFIFHTSY